MMNDKLLSGGWLRLLVIFSIAACHISATAASSQSSHDNSRYRTSERIDILDRREGTDVSQRNLQDSSDEDSQAYEVMSMPVVQRVRINAFDLLLAPTPVQLQRADEDEILVQLQELIVLFIKTQFKEQGMVQENGASTELEYVLFSDIVQNSWAQGKKYSDEPEPPRTILRFNGGVASFNGPDIPTEEKVNLWAQEAVDKLFTAALSSTPYKYVELAQYMLIDNQNSIDNPADISVTIPNIEALPADGLSSTSTPTETVARMIPQRIQQDLPTTANGSNEDSNTVIYALSALLCAMVVTGIVLSLWVRQNNQAIRVLCLSDKDQEEVVDFSDEGSISIKHEAEWKNNEFAHYDVDSDDDSYSKRDSRFQADEDDMKSQIAAATQQAIEEASLASGSTFQTQSALSFRSANPFSVNSMITRESFQKQRKTYLSKDMLYSPWEQAPDFAVACGKKHNETVLQPSHFSAKKELEILEKTAARSNTSMLKNMISKKKVADNQKNLSSGFRFEQAHENEEMDYRKSKNLSLPPKSSSRSRRRNGDEKLNTSRSAASEIV